MPQMRYKQCRCAVSMRGGSVSPRWWTWVWALTPPTLPTRPTWFFFVLDGGASVVVVDVVRRRPNPATTPPSPPPPPSLLLRSLVASFIQVVPIALRVLKVMRGLCGCASAAGWANTPALGCR
jgi:hypothetical protein